jgi:hypothetical protein
VSAEDKTCRSCGRSFSWRKKWARDWESVRYCSDSCRRRRVNAVDRQLEQAILELLAGRRADATICPSDAARQVSPDEWRDLMEPARRAARRLVAEGAVVITQGGRVVDPSTASGPIRIRRASPSPTG